MFYVLVSTAQDYKRRFHILDNDRTDSEFCAKCFAKVLKLKQRN